MTDVRQFDIRIQIIAIIGALFLMVGAVELVRRRKLGEVYSIIWITLGSIVLVFALFRNLQEVVAHWLGVYYPPSLLLGLLIFLQLGVILYLSVSISRLEVRNRILVQRLALLEQRIDAEVDSPHSSYQVNCIDSSNNRICDIR